MHANSRVFPFSFSERFLIFVAEMRTAEMYQARRVKETQSLRLRASVTVHSPWQDRTVERGGRGERGKEKRLNLDAALLKSLSTPRRFNAIEGNVGEASSTKSKMLEKISRMSRHDRH